MPSGAEARPQARLDPIEVFDGEARVRLRAGNLTLEGGFSSRDLTLAANPDAAFVAALPVAMGLASSLSVPGRVSPALLSASDTIQDVLAGWHPHLQRVELEAEPATVPAPGPSKTAAFFTCGVDSFYTVLSRREEIDAVVYAHGLDLPPGDPKRDLVSSAFREAAAELGLPAIELETDIRRFSDPVCDWERIYTGAALAAIAHLLADSFDRVLIPATHSYRDLHPTGSHPLLDPLYSSDRVRIEHVDAVTRVAKLEYLVGSELAMRSLRVCFQPGVDGLNCGRCAKCVRTMVGLRAIGAAGRCQSLPADFSLREMSSGKVRTRRSLTYAKENLAAVEARGTDPSLAVALRRLVARGARTEARQKSVLLARSARWAARAKLEGLKRRLRRG
ncbi:MAG TPA: hypothetical protein VEP91_08210 [Solirubrobacterales bacterium]|nr:hypothetical protein [Solirubrobacterales bacterium]